MLKLLNKELSLLIILTSIIINYILFLSPVSNGLIKFNFLIFIIFSLYYFFYLEKNIYLNIFIFLLIIISLGTPTVDWDARSIWLFKSKQIFFDQSILNVKNNYAEFSHTNYPSIAPAFSAGLVNLVGHWNEIYPKTAFTLLLIPPLIILSKNFNKNIFLICLSIILFTTGKFLVNGEMDGIVSLYFISSALIIYNLKNVDNLSNYEFYILIFFLIILSLLKLEGLVLIICLTIGSLISSIKKKNIFKKIIIIFLLSIIPITLWNLFTQHFNLGTTNENYIFDINDFYNRVFEINNYITIFNYLIFNDKFLASILFFFISLFFTVNKNTIIFITSVSIIYILFLFTVYLSSPLDLEWHLNSANRVIKPIALFIFILSLQNIYKQFGKI